VDRDAAIEDGFYETVAIGGGGAGTGHVAERTQHSLDLRDWHLADPELLAKHRPWVVRGGSIKTGPWRVVSAKTHYIGFSVSAGWPEIQEAFCIKLAAMLNGDDDASS
jgi:hypothetical protein